MTFPQDKVVAKVNPPPYTHPPTSLSELNVRVGGADSWRVNLFSNALHPSPTSRGVSGKIDKVTPVD